MTGDSHGQSQERKSRKTNDIYTCVFSSPSILLGYLADLTTHGGMVIGEKKVETGKQGMLAIEFPETLKDMLFTHITVPARVAWCRSDADNSYQYNIGFEFEELSTEHAKVIAAILRKYRF